MKTDRSSRWLAIGVACAVVACSITASPRASAQPAAPPPRPGAQPARAPAPAVQDVIAYAGATVHLGTGEVIEDGTVIIAGGKISRSARASPRPPARPVAAKGMVITPASSTRSPRWASSRSSLESSTPATSSADTSDIDPTPASAPPTATTRRVVIAVARSEGLTSAGVIPTGGLISGNRRGSISTAPQPRRRSPRPRSRCTSTSTATRPGEARARHGHPPGCARPSTTRARSEERAPRGSATRARPSPEPPRSRGPRGALDGKLPVVFHVDRAADILAALGLAKEIKLRPVIAGGAEAWKVAPALAAAKVPVIVFPLQQPPTFDALGAREDNAAMLDAAGVAVGDLHRARPTTRASSARWRATRCARDCRTRRPSPPYPRARRGAGDGRALWHARGRQGGEPRGLVRRSARLLTRVRAVVIRGRRASLHSRQTELLKRYRKLPR